jgi:hypothetical protein
MSLGKVFGSFECVVILKLAGWIVVPCPHHYFGRSLFYVRNVTFEFASGENVRPRQRYSDYQSLQRQLINQTSELHHSASTAVPAVFESRSVILLIRRTILTAKINLHYRVFEIK